MLKKYTIAIQTGSEYFIKLRDIWYDKFCKSLSAGADKYLILYGDYNGVSIDFTVYVLNSNVNDDLCKIMGMRLIKKSDDWINMYDNSRFEKIAKMFENASLMNSFADKLRRDEQFHLDDLLNKID